MFTIDLLKGQGIPIRCRPAGLSIVVITVAVPAIIAVLMLGSFFHNSVIASIEKQQVDNYDRKIEELADVVEYQRLLKNEKKAISNALAEVKSSINRHAQWSGVLMAVVENLPGSVVLTALEVDQNFKKKKVPKKDNPKKKLTIEIPVRSLTMTVCGDPSRNCDAAIRDFRDRLRLSEEIGPRLKGIVVSQRVDVLDDREVVNYEINCLFKEGL